MTASHPARPDGRRSRRDVTRQRLQRAAVDLFIEQGFGATSTVQIAERAGVSERTLFRAFSTKASLVWHDPFIYRLLTALEASPPTSTPVAQLLADTALQAVRAIPDDEWQLNVRRRLVALSTPELIAAGTQDLQSSADRIEAALRTVAGTAHQEPGPEPSTLTLFTWFTLVGFTRVPLTETTTREDWAQALVRIVDLAAHGALVNRLHT
ncbi:TetR/AcrR family transcriptional regulator [Sanguibacter suaedae]|uniref:TetR family transcriptional regulator n=1 Tax=Sanguibacter suaedae TaxID=2795737 RepID=A0A934IBB3_9MICO|nr:TetR/AcrR family transcriptional regulator [Sanguibacter suaedae]MBI9113739.1 TetR family transcriptional regulator [Sanguibacter suaedae]